MISHQHKCIFIHVPKTGGTSVEKAFLEDLNLSAKDQTSLVLGPNIGKVGPRRLSHFTIPELIESGHIDAKGVSSYFKFGFVRNPWDRLVSTYRYLQIGGEFKRFACDVLPNSLWKSKHYGYFVRPQFEYLHDRNGKILVDFTGRFECLDEDFGLVRQTLGISAPLLHVNKPRNHAPPLSSKLRQAAFGALMLNYAHMSGALQRKEAHGNFRAYYDAESASFIGNLYQKDVSLFQYTF